MVSVKTTRTAITALGIVLLAYLAAYHMREFTKFLTWANTGFRETQLYRASESPVTVAFLSVAEQDFESNPIPVAGDTLLTVNDTAAVLWTDHPCPAYRPLPLRFLHLGDTIVTAFAMRPPSRIAVWSVGLCGLLRFLISLLSLAVGLWALQSRRGSGVIPVFALYSFTVAAMVSLLYYFFPASYATVVLPFGVVLAAVWTLFGFLYGSLWLHLQLIYPQPLAIVRRHPVPVYALCYLPGVLLIFVWLSFTTGGFPFPGVASPDHAQLAQMVIATASAVASLFVLLYRYDSAKARLELRQIRLIIWAASAGVFVSIVPGLLGTLFPLWLNAHVYRPVVLYTATFATMLLGPLAFGYAFRRYRLMDVEARLRRGTRYVLVSAALVAFLGMITYASSEIILARLGVTGRAPGMFLAAVFALAFLPAQKRLNHLVEQHVYPERARLRQMLHDFLDRASQIPDLPTFLAELRDRLCDGLKVDTIYPELTGSGSFPFSAKSTLLEYLRESRRLLLLDENVGSRQIVLSSLEEDWLSGHGVELLLPLVHQGELLGVLAIGARRDEEDCDAEELAILNSLSPQIALAVENLHLLEDNVEKKRLEQELALARRTQEGLLLQSIPATPGLEIAATCRFCLEVAGDYYDVIRRPNGTVLAIGDVSGKGAAAALLMASLQAALHTAVSVSDSLVEVVAGINSLIYNSTRPEQYITFFVGMFDPQTMSLRYVNAGHNSPILLHTDGSHLLLNVGGPILGCLPGVAYQQGSVAIQTGDILLLYTDGVSEAMNGAGEEFGEERILQAMREHAGSSPKTLLAAIESAATDHHMSNIFSDDFTLLAARVA